MSTKTAAFSTIFPFLRLKPSIPLDGGRFSGYNTLILILNEKEFPK